MKSERAKEFLRNNREQVEINWETGETEWMIWPKDARKAVELAEQEMINKASKAYCFCRCGVASCIMKQVGRDDCKELREFKQKLIER